MADPTQARGCVPASPVSRRRALRRLSLLPATELGGLTGAALSAGCAAVPGATAGGTAVDPVSPWPDRRMLLLGELHDQPEHHRLRAEGLRAWAAAAQARGDTRPAVVAFEPMDRHREDDLALAYRALGLTGGPRPDDPPRPALGWPTDALEDAADRLAEAGGLDRGGWGWPLHRPLFMACLAIGARVSGANLDAATARAVARQGAAALPADLRAVLDADRSWSAREQQATEAEIDRGHCGLLPPSRWPAMALAQRARDAAMAQSLVAAAAGGRRRVVLIAGNGHVRRDLGVPRSLVALGVRPRDLQVVGYLEAPDAGATPPAGGAPAGAPVAAAPFDQLVYVRPIDRPDPCEGLARRL